VISLVVLGRALVLVWRGDPGGAGRLIGTRSAEEDIADEVRDLQQRQADLR
jgi:hypothetical protein